MKMDEGDLYFWLGFAAIFTPLTYFIYSTPYLPMVDLPYHVANLDILRNIANPNHLVASHYQINFFTPYAIGYLIVYFLGIFFPLGFAFKVALVMAAAASVIMMKGLLRLTQGEPVWALLTIPVFFGFNFYWGFFTYLIGIPFGLALVLVVWRCMNDGGSPAYYWLIGILHGLLFLNHLILFFVFTICTVALVLFGKSKTRMGPIIALVPVSIYALVWYVLNSGDSSHKIYFLVGWNRLVNLFSYVLQIHNLDYASAMIVAGAILFWWVLAWPRFADRRGFILLAIGLIIYLSLPMQVGEIVAISERNYIVLMFGILCFRGSGGKIRLFAGRLGTVLVVGIFCIWFCANLTKFSKETQDFSLMSENIPFNSRIDNQIRYSEGDVYSHKVYWHFGLWVQVQRRSIQQYSFGASGHLPVKFRDHITEHSLEDYDFMVTRTPSPLTNIELKEISEGKSIRPVGKFGLWSLYKYIYN